MENALNADLLQVKQRDTSVLGQYDLIGFGSGIYFDKYHSLLDFTDILPMLRNKKRSFFRQLEWVSGSCR